MIRAVLDTNQYVSMAIKAGGTADWLLAAWREERFVLLLSPPILDEIVRVLRSPRLRRLIRLTATELNGLIEKPNGLTGAKGAVHSDELRPGELDFRSFTAQGRPRRQACAASLCQASRPAPISRRA